MIDLRANPFFLDDEDIRWVEETLASMTLEEKAGQIFCALGIGDDEGMLRGMINGIGIGGIMYRPGPKAAVQNTHRKIQSMAKIPLLLAANTEAGGNGLSFEGTGFGAPMAVAAAGDPEYAYRMGYVACREGAAMGLNWSFAPIVDIDREFHNPITNTRTFGSDPDKVLACASRYLDAADECGVAVAIKHFPGDGVDERDQHILTSVNSLDCDEWMQTYGHIYRSLIDRGAKTVMVGHIAQPAWAGRINPGISKRDALCPASLSPEILTGLLLGCIADVLLNLRFVLKEKGQIIFLIGIIVFLSGHILYLIAVLQEARYWWICLIASIILTVLLMIWIFKQITAKKAFKIFGVVYIGAIMLLNCVAAGNLIASPSAFTAIFAAGSFLFLISDIVLILNTFGKETKQALRITNIALYYIGQILIALSLIFCK